jgi:hypothetical protein
VHIIYFSLVAFLIVLGCSKSDDFTVVNPNGNELKSGIVSLVLIEKPNLKMVHLVYTSPVNLENATVEITMPQIISFVNGPSSPIAQFSFTPNNVDKPTVITWVGNLTIGTPKTFCIIVEPDCNPSGKAVIWSDFKVNGVSIKGTIKNKVFACN